MRYFLLALLLLSPFQANATCTLGAALEHTYGPYTEDTRINTAGSSITAWGHGAEPKPDQEQIDSAIAGCTKEKARDAKIIEVKVYGESLWQDDFPGATFGTAKLVREALLSIIPGSRDLTTPIQNLNDVWQAGSADVSVLNNYTGLGSISAHDPAAWWP